MSIVKRAFLLLISLPVLFGTHAQTGLMDNSPLIPGKNFRIHPGNVSQTEVIVAKSPLDQNVLFAGCITISFLPSFFISEGIYSSADGGFTWQGNDTCTGEPIEFHGGDPGITIDEHGTFILTRLGRAPFVGLYSHYSYDNGRTWSSQKVISTDDLERASLTTDATASSSFSGRSYAAWVKFAMPFPLMFAFTDNSAQTWSVPKQVNNPAHRSAGGDLAIGPNGEVYLCWAGVTDDSPFKEIMAGFASSSNGGGDWNVTENAFSMNGITGVLAQKNGIRVNGLPSIAVDTTNGPRRGWIYMVTGQKDLSPAGSDPDIIMYRSTDGGLTWSAGIRVNQDALNNGKTQYLPNIHVDKYGAVDIIFYDDRTTTIDSAGVFLARSTDGGITWKEFEISDHHFEPAPIGGLGQGNQGDVIDLTSTDAGIRAVWMDNSTGIYQLWTVPIDYTSLEAIDDEERQPVSSFETLASPNPFRAETKISYYISATGFVALQVIDIFGNLVAEPVKEIQSPGQHTVIFNSDDPSVHPRLNSGIYFYRLKVKDRVETGRMVHL